MIDIQHEIVMSTINIVVRLALSPMLWVILKGIAELGTFEWAGWAKPNNKQLIVATLILAVLH